MRHPNAQLAVFSIMTALCGVTLGQRQSASSNAVNDAPANGGVRQLVYDVQGVWGREYFFQRVPNFVETHWSDIYVQNGLNLKPERVVLAGQDPQWSADGRKIAFLGFSTTPLFSGMGEHFESRQVQVMNADGSARVSISHVPAGVWDFAWSPVEQKIAYCEQSEDGRTAIIVINADGSNRTEVTKMGSVQCAAGRPVLKTQVQADEKEMLGKSVRGGNAVILAEATLNHHKSLETAWGQITGVPTLDWSPDGKRIAFTSISSGTAVIGVVGMTGENPKLVAKGYAARWSPDGKRLLLRHDSETNPPITSIWIANADGTAPRKVLDNEAADFGLRWFPDGKSIVFASEREHKDHAEVFRVNVDGTGLQKIATARDYAFASPVVSPDGTKLIVEAHAPWTYDGSQGDSSLWLIDLSNHRQERLAKGGSHSSVVWENPSVLSH